MNNNHKHNQGNQFHMHLKRYGIFWGYPVQKWLTNPMPHLPATVSSNDTFHNGYGMEFHNRL